MADLAAAVRGRRLALSLSQRELAARAGVSRDWINSFEAGKSTVELGHVIRLIDALGLSLSIDDIDAVASDAGPSVDLDALLDDYRRR
ncbi:MAG: helix-turn-helix domain-containing protein [Candidatus Dormibacteria bacterium]